MTVGTRTWGDTITLPPNPEHTAKAVGERELAHRFRTLKHRDPSGTQTKTFADRPGTNLSHSEGTTTAKPNAGPVWEVVPEQPNLGKMVSDLRELVLGEETDDYGVLRPTSCALNFTLRLLFECATRLGPRVVFPYGSISTDYEGGIRIEWQNRKHSVRLVVPARLDGKRYIYFEDGTTYRAVPTVTAAELCQPLEALLAA